MKFIVLAVAIAFLLSLHKAIGSKFHHVFHETTHKYGFAEEGLESGSHVVQVEDNVFHVYEPNSNKLIREYNFTTNAKLRSNPDNQWIAWYFKSQLSATSFGFTLFSSYFTVPALPTAKSNIAIFNSVQASYDPVSYNYILQPVLATGSWMLGSYPNEWVLSAVMCPYSGNCLFSKPISTKPGNSIYGTIRQLSGSTNSYKFEVNITDVTAKTPTQTIQYSTKYFAPWALVSLEHNPAGSLKSCNELPASTDITFTNNKLTPTSMDMWQGATSDNSCGLAVDMFVGDSSPLKIRL
eukprot:gene5630-6050_t